MTGMETYDREDAGMPEHIREENPGARSDTTFDWGEADVRRLALADLAAGMAHEVKNQLTVVAMSIQMALQGVGPDPAMLQNAWSAAMRAAALVDEILDYTRGTAVREGAGAGVAEAVESAVAGMWDTFTARQVRLEMAPVPQSLVVAVRPAALRVMITQMLELAVQAMPPGTCVVVDAVQDVDQVRVMLAGNTAPVPFWAEAASRDAVPRSAWEIMVTLACQAGAVLQREEGWPILVLPIKQFA